MFTVFFVDHWTIPYHPHLQTTAKPQRNCAHLTVLVSHGSTHAGFTLPKVQSLKSTWIPSNQQKPCESTGINGNQGESRGIKGNQQLNLTPDRARFNHKWAWQCLEAVRSQRIPVPRGSKRHFACLALAERSAALGIASQLRHRVIRRNQLFFEPTSS